MEKIRLNGGVILIGSLFWEDHLQFNKGEDFIRSDWRNQNLNMEHSKSVPLPIRYGRRSSSRFNTYTMIFCNSVNPSQSKGVFVPFNDSINSFEELYIQAIALAKAEGIYKNNNRRITSSWGSVGILINPQLEKIQPSISSYLHERWATLYSGYQDTFNSDEYAIPSVAPVFNQNGFLQIEWVDALNDFDFLLATPTIPNPKKQITEEEIVSAIMRSKNEKYPEGYSNYFDCNRKSGIETLQDDVIVELKSQISMIREQ
jgi:hypothetical protein